jgi:hypothetical protein
MSLDVSPQLLAQAEAGDVDPAAFVDTVRTSQRAQLLNQSPALRDC